LVALLGPPVNIQVTVNPTPRATPYNLSNLQPDASICFGGTTNIILTSPTVMYQPGWGNVIFDYKVSTTGVPGAVIGDTSHINNNLPNSKIIRSYQNLSDTLQSVYYYITPKLDMLFVRRGRYL